MNGASEIPKKLARKELIRVAKIAEGEEGEVVANANYLLGEDYYFYEKDPEGIQSALEHFQKAQKLGHQNAAKYLSIIEIELWKEKLKDPEFAVEVFTQVKIEQGQKLQLQEDEVRRKMGNLNQKEESLKSEIEELRLCKPLEVDRIFARENDLKIVQEERDELENECKEVEKGRNMIEEVAKDTISLENWKEQFTIPVVGSTKELEDTVVSIAGSTINKVYKNEELNCKNIIKLPTEETPNEETPNQTLDNDDKINSFIKEILNKDTIEGEEDRKNLLEVSRSLQKILEVIGNVFNNNHTKNITVVVGDTGAGKSTLCEWLTDQEMKIIEKKNQKRKFTFKDTDEISGGATSKTKLPQIKKIKRNGNSPVEYYCDCPGFHDTRGILQQIKNFMYIQHLFKNRNIKFLLAIHYACFLQERGDHVIRAFESLHAMINDPRKLLNSISLIVTNCPDEDNQMLVESKLKSDAKTLQESSLKELILHVANSKRIAFFSQPNSLEHRDYQYHPQSRQEKEKLLKILSELNFLPLEINDINFSPSFLEARFFLLQLFDNLQKQLEILLNQYAKSVKDHFITKRENFKTRVDELVQMAVIHLPPLVLFKGLFREFKDLCGSKITEKTTIARSLVIKLTSIKKGTVLFVGTVFDSSFTNALSKLYYDRGAFWIGKRLWEEFLTKEFTIEEGKILKKYLYNFITHLQYLKNFILDNNNVSYSYYDSNQTPMFDPPLSNPLNISEFNNITRLLHFLFNLQNKENNLPQSDYGMKAIWKTFDRSTETIFKQFCETEKDYYDFPGPRDTIAVPMGKFFQIYTRCLPFNILINQMKERGLAHIPVKFVDLLLRNYSKVLHADYHLPIYPPVKKEKMRKVKYYMKLCKCIYTNRNTRSFVINNLPHHISKIWQEIITKKNEVDRLYQTLLDVRHQNDDITNRDIIYSAGGVFAENILKPTILRSELTPVIHQDYDSCIIGINDFLSKIGEQPCTLEDLQNIGSAMGYFDQIRNKIHLEFKWYFNENHYDEKKNITEYFNYPVSHQSIVAASFLNKSLPYLNRMENGEIVILDVGFRNLKKLKGMCNVIKEKIFSFKKNPLAWFNGLGEVDYIAYIERDPKHIKDKLVIVYSGSNSIEDWKKNTSLPTSIFFDLNVHKGIGRLMDASKETYFSNLIDKIRQCYSTNKKPQKFKIVTTGHSLGGALALLAAYYFKHESVKILSNMLNIDTMNICVKCFTYGAPAIIADEPSKMQIENILGKNNIIETWNYHDPVPILTQKLGYEVGQNFPLFNLNNNNFGFFDKTFIGHWGHHSAGRYLHHLESILTPIPKSPLKVFITLLEDYAKNFLDIYRLGIDAGFFSNK